MERNVIEPGVHAFADRLEVRLGIAADRDVARGVGLLQRLDRGLEVGGSPELLCELSAQTGSRPDLVDEPSPGFRIGPPAQPELDELRLALAACALVAADELAIG